MRFSTQIGTSSANDGAVGQRPLPRRATQQPEESTPSSAEAFTCRTSGKESARERESESVTLAEREIQVCESPSVANRANFESSPPATSGTRVVRCVWSVARRTEAASGRFRQANGAGSRCPRTWWISTRRVFASENRPSTRERRRRGRRRCSCNTCVFRATAPTLLSERLQLLRPRSIRSR